MLLFTHEHVHFMASLLQCFAPLHEVHHSTAVERWKHENAATTGDVTYDQTNQRRCQDGHVRHHFVWTSLLTNEHMWIIILSKTFVVYNRQQQQQQQQNETAATTITAKRTNNTTNSKIFIFFLLLLLHVTT